MKKIVNELLDMFRGLDGKLSERRVFAFMILIGIIRQVERNCPADNAVLTTLCGTMLILLGLITWQNVKQAKLNSTTDENKTP